MFINIFVAVFLTGEREMHQFSNGDWTIFIVMCAIETVTVIATFYFAQKTGNPRFAYDSYRRFIQMYSDVVMEVSKSFFENIIDELKEEKGIQYDTEMTVEDLKELVNRFKKVYSDNMDGEEFPQDPKEQLMGAVKAVFRSWDNPRANVYRRDNDIPYSWGTAVNVQSMAFGNMGDDCGTGVAFTRDPATGEKGLFGEFLTNAQGEDVVAGVRTPQPISKLAEDLPECYEEFMKIANKLENHYKDMQDMEFTIQEGKFHQVKRMFADVGKKVLELKRVEFAGIFVLVTICQYA